ncbi:unnamed protein product [Cyprideis torosa]|uniref:Uncharacterized protein n=1 Tax=Cyprideis torosa TaxID=163714 RepID=A0A7R8WCI4_9CRUS|nr:unnamed protein product [Cyprideis torosa]CAG0887556.1 unnamed protein product [Cyprideis torosa]
MFPGNYVRVARETLDGNKEGQWNNDGAIHCTSASPAPGAVSIHHGDNSEEWKRAQTRLRALQRMAGGPLKPLVDDSQQTQLTTARGVTGYGCDPGGAWDPENEKGDLSMNSVFDTRMAQHLGSSVVEQQMDPVTSALLRNQAETTLAEMMPMFQGRFSTMIPPVPGAPERSRRERPPGCKTIFIGGLPPMADEEVIREVFERCGEIVSLRVSERNFAHIRFSEEHMVDNALFLSGYTMKVHRAPESDGSKIHVDFAQARDDQREFEQRQSQMDEERRRERRQQLAMRPPSPVSGLRFSEVEAVKVGEALKVKAIEQIFSSAKIKKCWDQFTKPQRKNIDNWSKQAEVIREVEMARIDRADEMDLSSDEENMNAANQVEVRRGEITVTDEEPSAKQARLDGRAFLGNTTSISEQNKDEVNIKAQSGEIERLRNELEKKKKQNEILTQTIQKLQQESLSRVKWEKRKGIDEDTTVGITTFEARVIAVTTSFLLMNPNGRHINAVLNFLDSMLSTDPMDLFKKNEVEDILSKFPRLFTKVYDPAIVLPPKGMDLSGTRGPWPKWRVAGIGDHPETEAAISEEESEVHPKETSEQEEIVLDESSNNRDRNSEEVSAADEKEVENAGKGSADDNERDKPPSELSVTAT